MGSGHGAPDASREAARELEHPLGHTRHTERMEPLHRTRQLTIAYERRHLLSTYRVIVVTMLGTALRTAAHAGRTRLQGTGAVSQEPLYELPLVSPPPPKTTIRRASHMA